METPNTTTERRSMKTTYVSNELARTLKDGGFNEPTDTYLYHAYGESRLHDRLDNVNQTDFDKKIEGVDYVMFDFNSHGFTSVPTIKQMLTWLESVKFEMLVGDFDGNIIYSIEGLYKGSFSDMEALGEQKQSDGFPSYIIAATFHNETYTGSKLIIPSPKTIRFSNTETLNQFNSLKPSILWKHIQ